MGNYFLSQIQEIPKEYSQNFLEVFHVKQVYSREHAHWEANCRRSNYHKNFCLFVSSWQWNCARKNRPKWLIMAEKWAITHSVTKCRCNYYFNKTNCPVVISKVEPAIWWRHKNPSSLTYRNITRYLKNKE